MGLIPGLGRSPGEGHGNALQYSCLENPMDKGDWQARVQRIAKSWTRLSDYTHTHTHTHTHTEADSMVLLLKDLQVADFSACLPLESDGMLL